MANNYSEGTMTPYIPASLIKEGTDLYRLIHEGSLEDKDGYPMSIGYDLDGDAYYFYANEDVGYFSNEVAEIFQKFLRTIPVDTMPYIIFEEAYTCSKMHQGEFGGAAWFITRKSIRCQGTSSWIAKMEEQYKNRRKHLKEVNER